MTKWMAVNMRHVTSREGKLRGQGVGVGHCVHPHYWHVFYITLYPTVTSHTSYILTLLTSQRKLPSKPNQTNFARMELLVEFTSDVGADPFTGHSIPNKDFERDTDAAQFPPADDDVRNFLTADGNQVDAYHRVCAFLEALFEHTAATIREKFGDVDVACGHPDSVPTYEKLMPM